MTVTLRKLAALLFLVAIALVPVVIVSFGSRGGGIWVAGYVTGIFTVPLVAIGVLRATSILFEPTDMEVVGFVFFSVLVIVISIAAILWSFLA